MEYAKSDRGWLSSVDCPEGSVIPRYWTGEVPPMDEDKPDASLSTLEETLLAFPRDNSIIVASGIRL